MKKQTPVIELSKNEQNKAAEKIKEYMQDTFEIEIGNLQAGIFLDYLTECLGPFYYNRGVEDSLRFMAEKTEELYLLMKDTEADQPD